eukprot:CAMPEP_0113660698 /NCGR_PEP_ID=MMETSP0017_2-20120614/33040_1 /TAXON_ID=2856 /ORGANISM="Cylindrotheca closterium" /LENGTH=41 /DNA_ID=CAMNT_0000575353 /DNA_START=526 /DNA_END=648 /DNA_ORIENTATION=+ /assembly_acc=CAM_ASM_000147
MISMWCEKLMLDSATFDKLISNGGCRNARLVDEMAEFRYDA